PVHYRIVLLDQRGSGRSTPLGSVAANTTAHLIADLEMLRRHLGIATWHVFGGSWGSTLALAYAQAHPAAVKSLTLRGIFLFRQREIDWYFRDLRLFLPENWRAFAGHLPP
ncbi:alpha/beta fold hydrolase, partial [Enterococcus faecium]|uniref:alpha/beta fold hydrolase n=1 Tax=Enterococcus faecium TaxID=1352 RepID=UPI003AAD9252